MLAQATSVTVSGSVRSNREKTAVSYVNITVTTTKDSAILAGTITDASGKFSLTGIKPGNYLLDISSVGFTRKSVSLYVGSVSAFLAIPVIELDEEAVSLDNVTVTAGGSGQGNVREKKVYLVSGNISQSGGSVLQNLQAAAGVTVQDGKVLLRGSDKVTVLIDGKLSALTGYGSQSGLDNIPSSAVDRIEIINNPPSRYESNGSAGIINIILKKEKQDGFNGRAGIALGAGSLWVRKENLPGMTPQYTVTPKINPSVSANYRKGDVNLFLQADNLYTHTLNKNEFVERTYDDGTVIKSQLKRNRNTNFFTSKVGVDWDLNKQDRLTISGMYGSEKIVDNGEQPFYGTESSKPQRMWTFREDEIKTTAIGSVDFLHRFSRAGQVLRAGANFNFHQEDEQYHYINTLPSSSGNDAFKLLSTEKIIDVNLDYVQPLRYGRFEAGVKMRYRVIPTDMDFRPGVNSVLDSSAGGWARYREVIPAGYGNYYYENQRWELEMGLRLEYAQVSYDVDPNHNTYKSNGYHYLQPFPNFRFGYKLDDDHRITLSYTRRIDRPNEVDIRIFPKYDDAEIIKVGNPALRPQYTNNIEAEYRNNRNRGGFQVALYHRFASGTITRIASIVPGSTLVYAVSQNAGTSFSTGLEAVFSQKVSKVYKFEVNGNIYRNQINAFEVQNLYPQPSVFQSAEQQQWSGNIKLNNQFSFTGGWQAQTLLAFMAPDIIPQGKILARYSLDAGVKKTIQKGKGEVFVNVTDLFNTMVIRKEIRGTGFRYTSDDYYETQVVRAGYTFKF
ncbi:putative TonB-dependent receptor [Flavihumibacter petaseus NBRC 106054]|uniref:Putative TonB-dependent receptor n=1 Tax=Flavihumibacter petaseus NBRC 106054 TaxID=1220578 RepID=A0A0E9MZR8_9BACT|nr:putative TonB-dependent receptor [Flavihumibacter petaseus NBRC 106054]